ncbi:MAG: hypothetical protein K9L64_04035 [Candidatus Izimaplasma sp.]|nr:hypothetical protein [Candidatus Izimaplasma bacterium]
MSDKNNDKEKKSKEEIRKEIEELEKLIEKVKKQNEQNRKKYGGRNPVLKINLAAVYSRNFFVNLIISFLINFIAFFIIIKVIGHLFLSSLNNDLYLLVIVFGLTLFEELYKKYLFKKHMQIVIYSVGSIFFLLNVIYLYFIDLLIFGKEFSFISPYHPIIFIIVFGFLRYFIKVIYKRANVLLNRKK